MNLIPHPAPAEPQRFVLHGVDWKVYDSIWKAVADRPVRLTYDGENLELMAPTWNHEWLKGRIGFVVPFVAVELNVDVQRGGSTTFRSEFLNRGLEPDECFYIGEHARQMSGLREIDLGRDPPPDLAIEIDITRSCLDRAAIYARLRVPEIWVSDGETLQAHRLGEDGNYHPADRSMWFPTLPLDELLAFLIQTRHETDTRLIALAQAWARSHVRPAQ